MKQSSNVPAFLSKLWTLVEETHTNEFITWSQNGQSFLVLDEQRFAKEILPKYFKHNNMASFVRQLNMYGFRKVVHIDSGIVKQERDGPVEFQHPYFKQGQDDLLENIKRKVSSSKPEENKIRQEDLTKIISSAQKVQIKQETIESRLSELKSEKVEESGDRSENKGLETTKNNVVQPVSEEGRKSKSKPDKQLIQYTAFPLLAFLDGNPASTVEQGSTTASSEVVSSVDKPIEVDELLDSSLDPEPTQSKLVRLEPLTEAEASEATLCSQYPDIVIVEDDNEDEYAPVIQSGEQSEPARESLSSGNDGTSPLMSSAVQLNGSSSLTTEDPVTMMDSILNDNINLLGKVELLDYLDSIDCSLEDFQAMLSGRQFSIDPDLLVDLFTSSVQMSPTDYINNTKVQGRR
ncbi:PREDICTED: heat shock factor protein 2 [Propithecus coquereli]|uniref:heat shock factor protein 2 n=1 Tax=Propithecus coquereli TaxID=379532 RepID=UPI00063EE67A|nr:PREDICTED: heat shock factor protein 2 [Propithecus coquereli]